MSWFKKILPKVSTAKKKGVPEGVWCKCEGCETLLYATDLKQNLGVCVKCSHHHYITARERLLSFFDPGSTKELAATVGPSDRLKFRDTKKYKDRIINAQKRTGEKEALIAMKGLLYKMPVVAAAFEFKFIGGSMSAAVGERFAIAAEAALKAKVPFVCFCTSGGARMQEGMFSLLQMAKTSAVIARLNEAKLPYITVLLNPTMGGVSASLATLGDVIIAEPNALIGFSGPRVIEQTIRQVLPEGFQKSEFLYEYGALDMIVDRRELRPTIASVLAKLTHQPAIVTAVNQ